MEARLFEEGTIPEWTTAAWYEGRARAPHLEQPGHRDRLLAAADYVAWCVEARGSRTAVDLGCGDGGLLSVLSRFPFKSFACWGYDLSPEAVEAARADRGVRAELLDFVAEEPLWADVAVLTETLEHLVDPHAMLRRVRGHASFVVASSPRMETAERHYEFHAWAWDAPGYLAMFAAAGWRAVFHEPVSWFQVLLAERDE
jgi:trans-aconitate methyltransferase